MLGMAGKQGRTHKRGPNTNVGRPAKSYIYQLCVNPGYRQENLPRAINDRDG